MESYEGDLTDIVGASSGEAYNNTTTCSSSSSQTATNNHFLHHHYFSSFMEGGTNFGDPFSNMRDPILYELDIMPSSSGNNSSPYFNNNTTVFGHKILQDDNIIRSSSRPNNNKNIFSNMIQISPNETKYNSTSLRAIQPSAVVSGNMMINETKDFLVDSTGVVQISSPRNPGLNRRKNQAKRVVCIPAPAAANSKQSGEVVPSDLWAWRKYGQKPIKGSPYPRGYYRCSSSKGCSARKQVERSRTDPNMLVITYTSEHNHPWPTQRNALAGSSRSQQQPCKNTNNNIEASHKGITITKPKEEQHEMIEVKDIEKHLLLEMDDDGELSDGIISYKACMLENNVTSHNSNNNQSDEEFFAELGEIEADDSLNLLFTSGFIDQKESKDLDPFHLFDWFEQPKRRL